MNKNIIQVSSSYFDDIVNTIREPLLILSKDFKVVSANLSFYKVFKVTQKETENKLIYELGDNQWDIPKLRELLERILPTKVEFNDYEVAHNFKLLGHRTMLLNARQIFSEGIGQELILLAIEDITEKKQIEKVLHNTYRELERVNGELGDFTNIISHDLQEPLRTINSYVQLLSKKYKGKLDKQADEYISFIGDASKRLKNMINALLDYCRIGANEEKLEQVDCTHILEEIIASLQSLIHKSKAKIKYESLPIVKANKAQLAQVFQNLIMNAIKFHKKNTAPEVTISASNDGNGYLFSISDNGIGIDLEHKDRIFQIFQRLHTREEYEGMGIGLTTCKKIVEKHNGKIWVESELGKGSIFYFTVPTTLPQFIFMD